MNLFKTKKFIKYWNHKLYSKIINKFPLTFCFSLTKTTYSYIYFNLKSKKKNKKKKKKKKKKTNINPTTKIITKATSIQIHY